AGSAAACGGASSATDQEKDVDQIQRRIRQPRDDIARIAIVQPDILRVGLFDMAQARSDAIEKRLDTDVSHVWMRGCLSDQMLAAAEADFQRYSPSSRGEGAGGWGETRCKEVRPTSCPLPSRGRE